MNKVRILHVSTAHPCQDPRLAYRVIPSLAPHYDLTAALPHVSTGYRNGVDYRWLPKFRRLLFRVLVSQPFVLWYAFRLRPQLLHIYDPELLPLARLIQLALSIPVLYEVHENLHKKKHEKATNQGAVFMWLFFLFDAMAQRRFHLIFTEHRYLDTYTNLAKPYAVIYNYPRLSFLDVFRSPYTPNQQEPIFFYIGWISFERAIDTLVAGLVLLKKRHPLFQVHLFGERTCTDDQLKELPGFASVQNNLHFHGYADQKKALSYTSQCTAGLALLKAVGDYPDSYTTKMFEYMALGLPVITSNFPLYRHVVERHQCGLCVDPTDPVQLADALTFLIENPAQSYDMSQRGRRAVETEYNWKSEAHKLLRFYELVFREGKQTRIQA